jgi:hypothetical protein
MLKIKAEEFMERHVGKYPDPLHRSADESAAPPAEPDALELAYYEFQSRITEPRVAAVRSKIGQINTPALEKLLVQSVVEDIFADVELEDPDTWAVVQQADSKRVGGLRAKVTAVTRPMVQSYLGELVRMNERLR